MAKYSKKERLIATFLSSFPILKELIKKIYILINYWIYKKKEKVYLYTDKIFLIDTFHLPNENDYFFGYYDKSPDNGEGSIVCNLSNRRTSKKPKSKDKIEIVLIDTLKHVSQIVGSSSSYTWQQGARCHWLTNNELIYNDFREGKYKAVIYSLTDKSEKKIFNYPVQDSFKTSYYLSINYERIMSLSPDYGYRNKPILPRNELNDLVHDGIWKIDYKSGTNILIHTLQSIVQCSFDKSFTECIHSVNHIMINSNGTGFIFIHRYYKGKRRYDRLLYSDFENLKVLVNENMVSHCCWVDENTILGYFRYNGKNGYYYCNVHSGEITPCSTMTNTNVGDGHPSSFGDWIVFDSYPDKSRMQHLYLYNRVQDKIFHLLEVFHGLNYFGESRCDLHPRFSKDGKKIFFDTVYTGKRTLCFIDIENIV